MIEKLSKLANTWGALMLVFTSGCAVVIWLSTAYATAADLNEVKQSISIVDKKQQMHITQVEIEGLLEDYPQDVRPEHIKRRVERLERYIELLQQAIANS